MSTCVLGFERVSAEPLLTARAAPWAYTEERPRPAIMFPTVVDMAACADHLPRPLARFYMYYAPHHSRAIGLATAPHPEGPWTPYPGNPILRLEQAPALRGHISAPEIIYRPDHPAAPFWMYFHGVGRVPGTGQQTCLAVSPDGLRWSLHTPEAILTATPAQSGEANTAAYVRVFRRGEWWYGLYKAEAAHCLARSRDGVQWEHWPHNPVILPEAAHGEYDRIRHTALLPLRGDALYFLYSTLTRPDLAHEEIRLASLRLGADDWLGWGPLRRHGTVLAPALAWEADDVRDPFVLQHDGRLYLYYVGGHEQGIGLATAPASVLERLPPGQAL